MTEVSEHIKGRILAPICVVGVLSIFISIIGAYWLQNEAIEDSVHHRISGMNRLYKELLLEQSQLMIGQIDFIKTDGRLLEPFMSGDRSGLYENARRFFERMRSKYRITHFYFHDQNQHCFLRVHAPGRHGDLIDRFTMKAAVSSGEPSYGIELGPLGTFTLRIVHPWKVGDRIIGYIELGMEIEHLTSLINEILEVELFVLIHKKHLDRAGWESGLKMLNRKGNWDLFDEYVIIDKTMDTTPVLNDEIYRYPRDREEIFSVKLGKRRYRGTIISLLDAGNRPVGEMVSLIDISDQYRNLLIMIAAIAAITMLIGAVLLLTFNFYIGGIQKRLIESRNTIRQEIQTRRQKEQELAESEKRFRSLFEDSMDTILIAGKEGHLHMLNPAGMRLFQLSAQDVKASNFNDSFCDSGVARSLLEKLSTNGAVRDFGAQLRNSEGTIMDCLITLTSKTDENGRFVSYEGIIRDVTPYKKMEEELRRLATTDSLTGVNNRRYFINLAQKELNRCKRYGHTSSLLMLDIDNFKRINDTYGHAAGDQVLKQFSNLCLGEIRECDILGRLGGEEFAVILIETDLSAAKIVAERIREVLEFHVMTINDSELRITASIGISEFQPADEPQALQIMMERADKALYDAKSNGKNQISIWHG